MEARAAVVIILVAFNLVLESHAKKGKWAQVKDAIGALENKVASLVAEQTSMLSEVGQELTSLADQLRTYMENNSCSAQGEEPSCFPGWHVFGTSCYLFVNEKKTWMDAVNFCKELGGYLAEVDTEDEDKFIFKLLRSTGKSGDGPWIGGHDRHTEGQWVWYTSGKAISYTNWNPSEPNGKSSENCLQYRFYSGRGWNDKKCEGFTTESICEMSK